MAESDDERADRIWDAIERHVVERGGDPDTIRIEGYRESLPPGGPITVEEVALRFGGMESNPRLFRDPAAEPIAHFTTTVGFGGFGPWQALSHVEVPFVDLETLCDRAGVTPETLDRNVFRNDAVDTRQSKEQVDRPGENP